jgi:hypothetical protein
MSTGKILAGLPFLAVGIIVVVLTIAPIPTFAAINIISRITDLVSSLSNLSAITSLFTSVEWIEINGLMLYVGLRFILAGVKSMSYEKEEKEYDYIRTRLGFMITGLILAVFAFAYMVMVILKMLNPNLTVFTSLIPMISTLSYPIILPVELIPILISFLVVFIVALVGGLFLKKGVQKELIGGESKADGGKKGKDEFYPSGLKNFHGEKPPVGKESKGATKESKGAEEDDF